MKDYIISQRLKELAPNGKMTEETRINLFKEYHQDIKNGVPVEESYARALLIIGNEKLIFATILKYVEGFNKVSKESEIYSYGLEGLIRAIDSFNLEKDVCFSTFAMLAIKHRIFFYLNQYNSQIKPIFISELATDKDGEETGFEIPDTYNLNEDVSKKIDIQEKQLAVISCFDHLTEKEQISIMYHFGLCGKPALKLDQIASITGNTRQNQHQRIIRAIAKIKTLLKYKNLPEYGEYELKGWLSKTYSLIPEVEEYYKSRNTITV